MNIKILWTSILKFIFLLNSIFMGAGLKAQSDYAIVIPPAGNSWIDYSSHKSNEVISRDGIRNWSDEETIIKTWFKTEKSGEIILGIRARIISGDSKIRVTLGKTSKEIVISETDYKTIYAGKFPVESSGYQFIEIQGIKKSGPVFAEIEDFRLGGKIANEDVRFVHDDFYWGRRGPSVHLNYLVPEGITDITWFYNEIKVPEGNDVLGSYFMADGFAQGYFGIQVNSAEERRVLFSVWSPYKTDNPKEIPENLRIKLLKKGEGVHAGEFGNEGSGGQSYLKYFWKAGVTYRFLINAKPSAEGYTDFEAWFYAPESGKWQLIASFRRPGATYITKLYSFLENFMTETGNIPRQGFFGNQWIYHTSGKWTELTKIKFTADATARKESRLDYAGGSDGKLFFLKNCGFFSDNTKIDTFFERGSNGIPPDVNFIDLQ